MNENNWNSGESPFSTCENYPDEISSAKAFDEAVTKSNLFDSWKEIKGETIHPLPGMNNKEFYRIDRILIPSLKLREAGWTKGLIGVELKRSGEKVGPPLSQMLDYLRVAWTSPQNIKVFLDYCFLWPLEKCGGPIASIMAQNHIGGCCLRYFPENNYHRLQFSIGEQFVLIYYFNRNLVEIQNLNTGNRTGSR
jgi:hypothetical protein